MRAGPASRRCSNAEANIGRARRRASDADSHSRQLLALCSKAWRVMAEQGLKPLRAGEVRFRVHGRQGEDGERVPASVFAQKLTVLVRALRAADTATNGRVTWDYVISDLRVGSAVVQLQEEQIRPSELIPTQSSVTAFDDCVEAIREGNIERAKAFGKCAAQVAKLAKGSGHRFGYAELWVDQDKPYRIDEFLHEQAATVVEPAKFFPGEYETVEPRWYRGTTRGRFEGIVKGVDLRGALPEVKLILSAGEKQIDCVFRDVDMERIREALDRKVQIEGTAFYDGRSGLPRRVEVTDIALAPTPGDFTKWRGSFEPFTAPDWESDIERD
jgi:hypothetical protein